MLLSARAACAAVASRARSGVKLPASGDFGEESEAELLASEFTIALTIKAFTIPGGQRASYEYRSD